MAKVSPFLTPGATSNASSLAILHLRRDQQIPTTLQHQNPGDEDLVANTRFGSYPHATLLNIPWGSQVLASNVNTGRGRGKKAKRKIDEVDGEADSMEVDSLPPTKQQRQAPPAASTGFCHILPPTPEAWTVSLPHRTQVVYTPDYSFVLQKMRVRPGCVLLEAGAGSGSFTHAAARAVFNGYPSQDQSSSRKHILGHVFSYEYHAPRADQLRLEIQEHGLDDIVTVTHRDVYAAGFLLLDPTSSNTTTPTRSPLATNIFLDLPDPSQALVHLTRTSPTSPLDPARTAYLTCFLPCIEQVTKAISDMRRHGWVEIQMFELAHRRLDVRREHVGLELEGQRGVNATAVSVEESIARLREVEERQMEYRAEAASDDDDDDDVDNDHDKRDDKPSKRKKKDKTPKVKVEQRESKQARLARLALQAKGRKMYKEGRLVHRTEPDLKTHTSYLVFGVLPREWTAADEERCREKYPVKLPASS